MSYIFIPIPIRFINVTVVIKQKFIIFDSVKIESINERS